MSQNHVNRKQEYIVTGADVFLVCPACDQVKRLTDFYSVSVYECKECSKQRSAETRNRYKRTVINQYGGKCTCCGESEIEFLSMDHVDGDGNRHRRENPSIRGSGIYPWLIKQKFPSNFQVLCYNCNLGKSSSKVCPHQKPK